MFVSVLNFPCIPQIGRLPAHGPNVKRLLIPRSVLLSGLLRIEEIEKVCLTEMSKNVDKNDRTIKVLRMGWPIVENVPMLCGSIFNLFRGPYLNFGNKSKKMSIFIKRKKYVFRIFLYGLFGVSCWGHSVATPRLYVEAPSSDAI